MFKRVHLLAGTIAYPIDVISMVHRIRGPKFIVVERAEQVEFNNHAALLGHCHKIFETLEISVVPASQIEFVTPVEVTGLVAPCPGTDVAQRFGRKGIVSNPERTGNLTVGSGKGPCVIKPVAGKRFQITDIVKIKIEHRTVVFTGTDKHGRPTPPQKVVGILRMQADGGLRIHPPWHEEPDDCDGLPNTVFHGRISPQTKCGQNHTSVSPLD